MKVWNAAASKRIWQQYLFDFSLSRTRRRIPKLDIGRRTCRPTALHLSPGKCQILIIRVYNTCFFSKGKSYSSHLSLSPDRWRSGHPEVDAFGSRVDFFFGLSNIKADKVRKSPKDLEISRMVDPTISKMSLGKVFPRIPTGVSGDLVKRGGRLRSWKTFGQKLRGLHSVQTWSGVDLSCHFLAVLPVDTAQGNVDLQKSLLSMEMWTATIFPFLQGAPCQLCKGHPSSAWGMERMHDPSLKLKSSPISLTILVEKVLPKNRRYPIHSKDVPTSWV